MAQKPARITRAEKREIQRLQRNFRSKFNRLISQGVPRDLLPSMDTSIISGMESRAELNAVKEQLRSFTNRGNQQYQFVTETGVDGVQTTLTKSDVTRRQIAEKRSAHFEKEIKKLQRRVNEAEKRFHERNKDAEFRIISEERAGRRTAKRTVGQDRLKPEPLEYTRTEFKTDADRRAYLDKLNKRMRNLKRADNTLYNSLQKAVTNKFGDAKGKEIIEAMKSMSPDDVAYLFETTDTLNFEFVYEFDKMDIPTETALDDLLYTLTSYMEGIT